LFTFATHLLRHNYTHVSPRLSRVKYQKALFFYFQFRIIVVFSPIPLFLLIFHPFVFGFFFEVLCVFRTLYVSLFFVMLRPHRVKFVSSLRNFRTGTAFLARRPFFTAL